MRTERLTIFFIVLVLALLAFALQGCFSETLPDWAEGYEYDSKEIFPIYVGDDGSAYVSATFGGEPLALLFNTSGDGLSITGNVVEQMGLQVVDDEMGNENGVDVHYRVPAFTAFGRLWKDQVVVPASETRYNGSIGPQFMNGSRFTLDYGHQLMAVSESPLPEHLLGEDTIAMELSDESLLPVVKGWLFDEPVLLELDTGSSQTVIDTLLARKIGLEIEEDGVSTAVVRLGAYTFSIESATVQLLPITGDLRRVRLGSDVLSQMLITVDYLSGTVAIQPNQQNTPLPE
jgi:hypothetical protein